MDKSTRLYQATSIVRTPLTARATMVLVTNETIQVVMDPDQETNMVHTT